MADTARKDDDGNLQRPEALRPLDALRRALADANVRLAEANSRLAEANVIASQMLGTDDRQRRYFDRDHPPPGMTWRAALEHGRRGDYAITRVGRTAVINVEEWQRWAAMCTSLAKPRASGRDAVTESDEAALRQLGLVVPIRIRRA